MANKKILFTIQWYPSVLSANALCDENLIRALHETGEYDITCLVYSTPELKKYEVIEGIKVHRFKKGILWDEVIKAKKNPLHNKSKAILKINRIAQRFKQALLIPVYPVFEPFAIRRFANKAIKLHRRERFDIIISEHNGLDSLLAGYYTKLKDSKIKYIPIFWDPLYGKEAAKYLPKWYSKKKQKAMEEKILSIADKAIFMESMKSFHTLNNVHYGSKNVYMSFPKLLKPSSEIIGDAYTIGDKINIVFSGILNLPDRDPSLLLEVISRSAYADKINMLFFCTGSGRSTVEHFKSTFRGSVVISSYIPATTLKNVYQNSEMLLNIGGPNPNMIPSKIYDYMSYCKPIISTYYIEDEASRSILEKYPAVLFLDLRSTVDENVKKFDSFLKQCDSFNVDFTDVEARFPLNSPRCYVELLDSLESLT